MKIYCLWVWLLVSTITQAQNKQWTALHSELLLEDTLIVSSSTIKEYAYALNRQHLAVAYDVSNNASYLIYKVAVYTQKGNQWQRVGPAILVEEVKQLALSMDGTRLMVVYNAIYGSKSAFKDKISGYTWNGQTWQRGPMLEAEQINALVMSQAGGVVAVGYQKDNKELVQVFDWKEETWHTKGQLLVEEQSFSDFGKVLALSGNGQRLLIGAAQYTEEQSNDNAGKIYAYEWTGEQWQDRGSIRDNRNMELLEKDKKLTIFDLETALALSYDGKIVVAKLWQYSSRREGLGVGIFSWQDSGMASTPQQYLSYRGDQYPFGDDLHLSENGRVIGIEFYNNDRKRQLEQRGMLLYHQTKKGWQLKKKLLMEVDSDWRQKEFFLALDGRSIWQRPSRTYKRSKTRYSTYQYTYSNQLPVQQFTARRALFCQDYQAPSGRIYTQTGHYIDTLDHTWGQELTYLYLSKANISSEVWQVDAALIAQEPLLEGVEMGCLDCATGKYIEQHGFGYKQERGVFYPPKTGSYALMIKKQGCVVVSDCQAVFVGETAPEK